MQVGSLAVGKEADFVVISQDIMLPANKNNIKNTIIYETVFRGRSIYYNYWWLWLPILCFNRWC